MDTQSFSAFTRSWAGRRAGPGFGKAPAQLAARIVGDVPKQLAQLGAMDRTRRHDEIGDKRPHFARRGSAAADPFLTTVKGPNRRTATGAATPPGVVRVYCRLPHQLPPTLDTRSYLKKCWKSVT